VSLDTFYKAINKVQRSLIRTDADEVTYNLHVMIRFDLELQLLEGSLAVKDLPEAWHARYQQDLGLHAPSDVDGCLQDVHWYGGLIGGAFQGYTLGNILSGLFYSQALKVNPQIPAEIGQGKFDTLHSWLKENIYHPGRKYTAPELIEKVTGGPLTIAPYIQYLKTKYGALYNL
jgi:carboxypeptidase Taq